APSADTLFALHDLALHRQLVGGAGEGLASRLLVGVGQLEHDPTRLHVCDPPLRRALAGAHAGLGGLLRDGAVRVDVDPDLATTADVPVDRDTRRLDLPVREV